VLRPVMSRINRRRLESARRTNSHRIRQESQLIIERLQQGGDSSWLAELSDGATSEKEAVHR
jgi:hypothetical protein